MAQACATEAFRVAVASGVELGFDDPVAWVRDFGSAIPGARPSMLLDVLAGRRARSSDQRRDPAAGRRARDAAPVNRTVTALVRAIERTGTAPLPQSGLIGVELRRTPRGRAERLGAARGTPA